MAGFSRWGSGCGAGGKGAARRAGEARGQGGSAVVRVWAVGAKWVGCSWRALEVLVEDVLPGESASAAAARVSSPADCAWGGVAYGAWPEAVVETGPVVVAVE